MREEFLLDPARQALQEASDADRARFEQMIRRLCDDPTLGTSVPTLPDDLAVEFFRYEDAGLAVVYDLPDAATLRVWGIGWGPEGGRAG